MFIYVKLDCCNILNEKKIFSSNVFQFKNVFILVVAYFYIECINIATR